MKGIKKIITFLGALLLIIALLIIGKAAIKKDAANRQNEYREQVAAKQQNEPPAPASLGSKWNPISLTHIINNCAGVYVINPGDSVFVYFGDLRFIGYSIRYFSPDSKIRVIRINNGRTLKVLEETPGKKISKSKMDGIDKICVKNLGEDEVRLYAWYGYKSAAKLTQLGGY